MENNLKNLIEYSPGGILSQEVFKNEAFDCTLFTMAEGTKISTHTSAKQGFVYIIEGQGVFNLEGKNIIMEPGVFIYMKESADHSLRAEKNTAFLLTLITEKNEGN